MTDGDDDMWHALNGDDDEHFLKTAVLRRYCEYHSKLRPNGQQFKNAKLRPKGQQFNGVGLEYSIAPRLIASELTFQFLTVIGNDPVHACSVAPNL